MSCDGIKRELALNIVDVLFGHTAKEVATCINDYGPATLAFINFHTKISVSDIQTICIALYTHGVVSITNEGKKATFSFCSFPLFILATPSLLLDEIRAKYVRQDLVNVLQVYLREGICTKEMGEQEMPPSEVAIDFSKVTDDLFEYGFLIKGLKCYVPFTSQQVFNLERRILNLQLNKKTRASSKDDDSSSKKNRKQQAQAAPVIDEGTDAYSINWNYCIQFLRGRQIVNFVHKIFGEDYSKIIEIIVSSRSCCDYSAFKSISEHNDETLRNSGKVSGSIISSEEIYSAMTTNEGLSANVFFERLYKLADPILNLITIDGEGYLNINIPHCIRQIQKMNTVSFADSQLCGMHARVLSTLQDLEIADTRQLEDEAIVSDKEARCAMYNLYRLGLTQIQAIPKGADHMIGNMLFVWRYNDDTSIAETGNHIGRVALNMWDKITACIEDSDSVADADSLDKEASITKSQEEKNLSGFHSYFINQMRTYILFVEM